MIQITNATCIAYLEDGRICRKKAVVLDIQRGGMICLEHAATLPKAPIEKAIAETESAVNLNEAHYDK